MLLNFEEHLKFSTELGIIETGFAAPQKKDFELDALQTKKHTT